MASKDEVKVLVLQLEAHVEAFRKEHNLSQILMTALVLLLATAMRDASMEAVINALDKPQKEN